MERLPADASMPLWGGIECTVNRIGDRLLDHLATAGHDAREDDLDRAARLGLRTLRLPVLWERVAPSGLASADWRIADRDLLSARRLGITPIVGLVHHGSGPLSTSLVDRSFVDGLAAYAGAVAARYPWVTAFTPVNEPLTTARFSGLYGLWYPHGRDDRTFVRALIIEALATQAAMQAIRRVTPGARLVATDDLGYTHTAVPALRAQADFENERRWLGWDLLAGRVCRGHALYDYLVRHGAPERTLARLADAPSVPDLIGVNHYVTSERLLDVRRPCYPPHVYAANDRQRYVDIEAVRATTLRGLQRLLLDAHARYDLPLAVTEAHIGCTPDEQCRWLASSVEAAEDARSAGADVRAVTVWALFGSYDWASLRTREDGCYEPGAFCLRTGTPRETPLASLVRRLAAGERPHDFPATPGWWEREDRLLYPMALRPHARARLCSRRRGRRSHRLRRAA